MNKVVIEGYVESVNSESSEAVLVVKRNSGVNDYIPVKTHDQVEEGTHVALTGSLNTQNILGEDDGKSHKKMYVWGNIIDPANSYVNDVEFDGVICKKDVLRGTPQGRTIIDFIVAVNSGYRRSSYISCIAWSGSARWVESLVIGTKVHVKGRFQSRDYIKNSESRTAYEISVNEIYEVKDEDTQKIKDTPSDLYHLQKCIATKVKRSEK